MIPRLVIYTNVYKPPRLSVINKQQTSTNLQE